MNNIYQIPSDSCALGTRPEKLLTIKEAADILDAYYWQLQRAVKRGDIPSYTPFNSRKLVKLSEVVAYIESCRQGGVE
ncbi:helix-turn-helix domain-containing protein [Rhizobium changzhiense]|uniref:helix-turn-helix domain-containing protein n=1 Tax=Rhizobium changzhiense TaxID=2692317 RepID=UPI001F0C3D87|nr:helix-turn-helix domain-containing protein [Rhizobium changzhiense]MCH4548064.1 helix-turn-helix domain-containing protein [Rhizobium changzhiense]